MWPAPRRRRVLLSVAPCPSANRCVRLSPCSAVPISAVWSSPCQPSRLASSRRRVACALTSSRLALRRALPICQPSRLVVALQRRACSAVWSSPCQPSRLATSRCPAQPPIKRLVVALPALDRRALPLCRVLPSRRALPSCDQPSRPVISPVQPPRPAAVSQPAIVYRVSPSTPALSYRVVRIAVSCSAYRSQRLLYEALAVNVALLLRALLLCARALPTSPRPALPASPRPASFSSPCQLLRALPASPRPASAASPRPASPRQRRPRPASFSAPCFSCCASPRPASPRPASASPRLACAQLLCSVALRSAALCCCVPNLPSALPSALQTHLHPAWCGERGRRRPTADANANALLPKPTPCRYCSCLCLAIPV